MKKRTRIGLALAMLIGSAGLVAAQTDGTATFRVTTVTAGGAYAPSHVLAVWVTDAQTNFVKTLKRQAQSRIQYLSRWGQVSQSNVVDAITGATLGSHQTHTLTWNCRNVGGALVPDGTYRFFVEFTDYNGAGPWTSTNILSFYKGSGGVTSYPPNQANFNNLMVQYVPGTGGGASLPGTLEAEDYSTFFDTTAGNDGGQYRADNVDIEICAEGGYDVGWISATEWLGFNTTVGATAAYDFRFRVSSADNAVKSLHVEVDGTNVTGAVNFNTGGAGWQAWTNAWVSNVTLYAGARAVRVVMDSGNFNLNYIAVTLSPAHNVAIGRIAIPGFLPVGTVTDVVVTVTNRGDFTENVTVTLSNATDRVLMGTRAVSAFVAGGSSNLAFTWNTATASTGLHTLVAAVAPVAGEVSLADNTGSVAVLVALGIVTNTVVAKGSGWRYSDEGLDLSGTPWREAAYYDGHWAQGPAVLGFGNGGEATVLATAASATSLLGLVNAGFERPGTGGADKATNWNGEAVGGVVMGGSWGAASRELWRSHSGGWEASVHDWGASGSGAGWWQQVTNDLGAGSLWTASIWAWNDNGQSGIYFTNASSTYYLKIEWYNGVLQLVSENSANIPLPGEVWTKGSMQATAPAGAAWVRFLTGAEGMSASGGLQFDDASLTGFRAGRTTWYLRRDVYFDAPPVAVSANVRRDDGVALYVNGAEALRDGLPAGTLTAAIEATNTVHGAAESNYIARSLSAGLFGAGRNVIAAEVHQAHGEHPVVSSVWINELHYDNTGTDTNEGVEIVGPAGTDLAAYKLLLYNGGSDIYRTSSLTGIVPDQSNGCGAVWIPVPSLQNGVTDGFALVYWPTSVVQLLSYEGVFTATVGAAAGMISTDIGVTEPGSVGQTLQLSGTGIAYSAFTWVGPIAGSTGTLNSGQGILPPEPPDLAYDLELVAVTTVADLLRSVSATAVDAPATVIGGDRATIAVMVTNSGQTVESFLVVLVDTNTGAIVGSQMVSNLVAGNMAELVFDWNTFGVAGTTAYLASSYAGVQTLDLSAPLAPVVQGTYPSGSRAADVAVSGMLAYVAAGELGLQVVSVSNAARPVLLGSASGISNARRVALNGSLAVVGDGASGIRIVNVANPALPVVVGSFANTNLVFTRSVAAAGSFAAATDGRRILLINISNPAAPVLQSLFTSSGFVFDLAMTTSHVFAAAGGDGLVVRSIPSLSSAGGYNTPGMAVAVALEGSRAHVADGEGGWNVFDVSNPAAPALLGASLAQGPVENVAVAAYLAAYAGPSNVVSALDVSAPLSPIARGSFDRVVQVLRLASAGPYVLTAEDDAGAAIFDILPDDHDTDRMSDAWEQQIVDADPFDGITSVEDVLPDDDFDHDGLSNRSEFIAGTEPTNSASVFAIAASALAPGSKYVVRWHSVPGKVYNLYSTTNLASGFSALQSDIPAAAPLNSYTDTVSSVAARYYMVGTRE